MKTKDLQTLIAVTASQALATAARNRAAGAITSGNTVKAIEAAQAAVTAVADSQLADAAFRKLPPLRRQLAETAYKIGLECGDYAARQGGDYSGETTYRARWGDTPSARTDTSRGEQYSRKCTYKKTNAYHVVTLDPAGIPALVEAEALRLASQAEGLPLIALYPDGRAVWVRAKGKTIISEAGFVAFGEGHCFHSQKSLADAQARLGKKLATIKRERDAARANHKAERRARLIARLCNHATATIADARALGFCSPGIAAFQARHNVGDTATLPDLIRTGDPSATRLALAVARKVS